MSIDYDIDALCGWREERDEHFRTHYTSPIPEEHLPGFSGLKYFDTGLWRDARLPAA